MPSGADLLYQKMLAEAGYVNGVGSSGSGAELEAKSLKAGIALGRKRTLVPGVPVMALTSGVWSWNNNSGSAVGYTWHTRYRVLKECSDIVLIWTNGITHLGTNVNTGEGLAPNDMPIKASVQLGNTLYRVHFNGNRQTTLEPGGMKISDPISIELKAGDEIIVRTFNALTNVGPMKLPFGMAPYFDEAPTYTAAGQGFTLGADKTDVLDVHTTNQNAGWGGPTLILGSANGDPGNSVYAIGDSIDAGYGEDNALWAKGWILRAMWDKVPIFRNTYTGMALNGFRLAHARDGVFLGNFTHLLCGFGSNDVFYGRTYDQIIADYVWVHTMAKNKGLKTIQRTIPPRTNAANNAVIAGFEPDATSMKNRVNAWIKNGGNGLIDYVVDITTPLEVASTGLWKNAAHHSGDGAHLSVEGSKVVASVFDINKM